MKQLTIESFIKEYRELGIPYLNLQLDSQTQVGLPMENTQEVLTTNRGRITPIPNMAKSVIGLLNQRSRVFWVINLAELLGLKSTTEEKQQYNIAIIKVGKIALGLAIEKIKGVIRVDYNQIQSPLGEVSDDLIPYLKGYVMYAEHKILILDADAIINSPLLQ
jgi:twitching motility protein PilI